MARHYRKPLHMPSTTAHMTAANLGYGDFLSLYLGGAIGHSAVAVTLVHATVIAATAKAVRLRGDSGAPCWFPRKALVARDGVEATFTVASWLNDGYVNRWLDFNASHSGLSA